jgi:hypothetical protein
MKSTAQSVNISNNCNGTGPALEPLTFLPDKIKSLGRMINAKQSSANILSLCGKNLKTPIY